MTEPAALRGGPAPEAEAEVGQTLAAIDLGSNSFHLLIAREADGALQVLDRLREMVQLGAGLDARRNLTPVAMERALACLERFGQRLRGMPPGTVRAVGTNTLRMAHNGAQFIGAAQRALGHPIEVIAGREEARLIYLGVAHSLADDAGRRLVMDIGGGSTEFIIGERFETAETESLHMGCVSYTLTHFADDALSRANLDRAVLAARQELQAIEQNYRRLGWESVAGASGTIRSIQEVVFANGWSDDGITLASLKKLRKALIAQEAVSRLRLEGLRPDRATIFPGGFAILLAAFESLGIERMRVSDGALREGLLFDLAGRIRHEDVRDRTIGALGRRLGVDESQAARVESAALAGLEQVREAWKLHCPELADLLRWGARLHEVGLVVAHNQFHKHGAYLVANADLPGFSRQEQQLLAAMVRGHRRKFPVAVFQHLAAGERRCALRLCILLRLAALLHRSHSEVPLPDVRLRAEGRGLEVVFPEGWLDGHPLTRADLEQEAAYLRAARYRLTFR